MNNDSVKSLLNLLSGCLSDDQVLGNIIYEKMTQSLEYIRVTNIDNYAFISNEAKTLEKRVREFKATVLTPANYGSAIRMMENLNRLYQQYSQLVDETTHNARSSITEPYRPIHIIDKRELSGIIDDKNRRLLDSDGYKIWAERDGYIYTNAAAGQLKQDMDAYHYDDKNLEAIHDTYQVYESFKSRWDSNQNGIITKARSREIKSGNTVNIIMNILAVLAVIVTVIAFGDALISGFREGFFNGLGDLIALGVLCVAGYYVAFPVSIVVLFILEKISPGIDDHENFNIFVFSIALSMWLIGIVFTLIFGK